MALCRPVTATFVFTGIFGVASVCAQTEVTPGAAGVTASTHDGNVPANTVDGSLSTRWSANGDAQWIQYDLGASRTVTHLTVAFYLGNSRQAEFDLQVSSDGESWTNVLTGASSSGASTQEQTFDFADTTARYVRYLGHGNSVNTWNSVTEVRIFAADAAGSTPTQTPTPRVTPAATPTPTPTPTSTSSGPTVTVTLDPANARVAAIPSDFAGLSLEMQAMRSNFRTPNGNWLSGSNSAYIAMLRRLGVRHMRVGGNTMERTGTQYAYPSDADARAANDFMNALGGNLLWGVPVASKYNASSYSGYAQRMSADKRQKGYSFGTVFHVGNEPDGFGVSQSTWQGRFDAYSDAFEAALGSTDARYGGPGCASSQSYANSLVQNPRYLGSLKSHVGPITHHWYPFGGASSYSSPGAAISSMLSSGNSSRYQSFYNGWARNAENAGFKPRLDETNSLYQGGYSGASDAFAAALWSLDYLSYFAQNTMLAGINFHTANQTSAYNPIEPVGLASSYTLKAVGYGLLAFDQLGQGRPVPRTISNPSNVNLTAYALLRTDGSETLRLINKTYGTSGVDATVVVVPGKTFTRAEVMYLRQSTSSVTATSGITLGGQSVSGSGAWNGTFTQTLTPVNGRFTIPVPRAQAAIVHLF